MTDIGYGTTLTFGTFTGNIMDIDGPSLSVGETETTHMLSPDSYREFLRTLIDPGELTFDMHFDPDQTPPVEQTQGTLTITFPLPEGASTPATWVVEAFVTKSGVAIPVQELMKLSVSFRLSGKIVITPSA